MDFHKAGIPVVSGKKKVASADAMGIPYSYYTHVFGPAETFRGSENDPVFLASRCLKSGNTPRMFLACGTEDFLFSNNLAYHDALVKMGCEHVWFTAPGIHDFVFWETAAAKSIARWRGEEE